MALTKVNTDLLADGGKLNGIEAGADVTDTTNVTAAGALMDSELTSIASVKALDQGVATTDSPTFAGLNASGNLTLDVAGDIILDADGGSVFFKDAGTEFFKIRNTGSDVQIYSARPDADMKFEGVDGSVGITALHLDMSDGGTATFNSHIRLGDNKTASFGAGFDLEITSDGTNGTIGATNGNLTLDVAGTITLDADNTGTIYLSDGGTNYGLFFQDSNRFFIQSQVSDADMLFRGSDAGTVFTALTLDMSNAGAATFSSSVTADGQLTSARGSDTGTYGFRHEGAGKYLRMGVPNASFAYFETDANGGFSFEGDVSVANKIIHAGDTNTYLTFANNDDFRIVVGNSTRAAFNTSKIHFNQEGIDQDFQVESDGNANMLFVDGGNNRIGFGLSNPAQSFAVQFATADRVGTFYDTGTNGNSMYNGAAVLGVSRSSNGSTSLHGPIFEVGRDNGLNATYNVSDRFLTVRSDSTVINEDSQDHDFRVESESYSRALHVDAGTDDIRMGGTNTQPWGQTTGLGTFQYKITEHSAQISTDSATGYANLYLNKFNITADDTRLIAFYVDGNQVATITGSTTGVTYNTSSDRRLKKDIETITDGTDKLMAMNPVTHGWKADPEADTVHGFIAQEMMDIVPEAVSGDPESDEMMSMDYGRITPVIVAALQDALTKIETLETRLTALENA